MNVNIETLARRMREEIRNAPDTVKAAKGGQSYYISGTGDDRNSGKSPEEGWATLSKVNSAKLQPGDAVYFQRGAIFRGQLIPKSGVSYGAYGSGEKPCIYGSTMNMAEASWQETDENIWVCEATLPLDVGIVVINNGTAVGVKRLQMDLKENLDFFYNNNDYKVYMYHDEGDPGKAFQSIEMGERRHIIYAQDLRDVTFENLCLKYGGSHGIGGSNMVNVTVRHCELGWIGGSIQYGTTRYGNAIENWEGCDNFIIDGCYVYQIYDAGITHQGEKETIVSNTVFRNNLIEYCTYSIEYFQRNYKSMMSNITYEGNLLRLAGYGWGHQRPDKTQAAHIKSWRHPNPSENFVIQNNILDTSRFKLFQIVAKAGKDSLPVMTGNTYSQTPEGLGCEWDNTIVDFDDNIESFIRENVDSTPTVIHKNRYWDI